DFEARKPIVIPAKLAAKEGIFFDINGFNNLPYAPPRPLPEHIELTKHPISFEHYAKAFEIVQKGLRAGNSYLTNLTFPTPITLQGELDSIFYQNTATYRLLFKNQFTVFSPECFVKIKDGHIYSYPMKGTIDAALPNAAARILGDAKEKAEHYTIVDLIRNDLGRVASRVHVEQFRYLDHIRTHDKNLLQVSSKIVGRLPQYYQNEVGSLLLRLLPAGSISGAPKAKTLEIIKDAEGYDRGYYTGIFGYYANGYLESAVMIRFIERAGEQFYFKSGGGITAFSEAETEYQELIDKVYVPAFGKYQDRTRAGEALALS
ncbi:MAG: aminodeoxychorismate synthase component I, partial [Bacteroidota bacterium]